MDRMTGQAFRNLLTGKMRFMAFHAGRDETVVVMVAILTGNFCCVFAGKFAHLP